MSRSLARARSALPVTAESIYLGTGSWGPVSRVFASTLRRAVLDELKRGRMSPDRFEAMPRATEQVRQLLAELVGVAPTRLALTRSTSDSLDTVIRSFPLEVGDEVVCTQHEHHAVTDPLSAEAARRKFNVRIAQVPDEGADDLHWLERCVTARTRLIAFSSVSYTTGQLLPISDIAAYARERGIRTLLDAAQSVGAMPLDLASCGVDFCGFPLQKWLLGPEGMGGLYVRDERFDELLGDRMTQSRGVLEATAAQLAWLRDRIGWSFIFEQTEDLGALARDKFARVPDLAVLTPAAHAGLVTVETDPARHAAIMRKAKRRRIVLRSWPELGRYRISTAFFNTEAEISAAAALFRTR